jgi:MoaA/NifB/PqqE/SkfB family radical SAM enzyme
VAPVLQLHPARRCNLACAHCYTASGPRAAEAVRPELLHACVDDAVALGYRQLAVSGGEPLLDRGLPGLLARARGRGMLTTLTTNGMLATPPRWAQVAPLLDLVAVSIDGTEAEHDALRRRPGAFARTVANLATIRASRVPFALIFTLTLHNVASLESVVRLAAAQGAAGVQVHPLTLDGRAADELPGSRPDGLELAVALLEAVRLGVELGVPVHVDAVDAAQLAAHREHLVPARPVRRLTAVAPVLVVQADAAVVPMTHAVHRHLWLGSLEDAPLAELAARWLARGRGDRLAAACERTWEDLLRAGPLAPAVYWYDEVAARTAPVALAA